MPLNIVGLPFCTNSNSHVKQGYYAGYGWVGNAWDRFWISISLRGFFIIGFGAWYSFIRNLRQHHIIPAPTVYNGPYVSLWQNAGFYFLSYFSFIKLLPCSPLYVFSLMILDLNLFCNVTFYPRVCDQKHIHSLVYYNLFLQEKQ